MGRELYKDFINVFPERVAKELMDHPMCFATYLSGQSIGDLRTGQVNDFLSTYWHNGDPVEDVSNNRTQVIVRKDNPFKSAGIYFDPSEYQEIHGSVNMIVELAVKHFMLNGEDGMPFRGWNVLTTTTIEDDDGKVRRFSVSCPINSDKLEIHRVDSNNTQKLQYLCILVPRDYDPKQLVEE